MRRKATRPNTKASASTISAGVSRPSSSSAEVSSEMPATAMSAQFERCAKKARCCMAPRTTSSASSPTVT